MATHKQKMALTKIVENRGNISKAMIEVGYSPATAKNPKNLTESLGYKELCKECGLTEELIICSLVEDIKSKPMDRVSELLLASKLLGLLNRIGRESFGGIKPSEEDMELARKALEGLGWEG